MSRALKIVIAIAASVVVLFGAAFLFLTLRSNDSPPPVSLSAITTPTGTTGTTGPPATAPSTSATSGPSAAGSAYDGNWAVAPGGDSFVGYRIREQLAGLSVPNDAVGRTAAVTANLTIAGTRATAAKVSADVRELKSDDSSRDNQMRRQGLQSDRFPDAIFELTTPIEFGTPPEPGKQLQAGALGKLTLHGVTKDVEVPVQAQINGDRIEVIGSLPIVLADYGMATPQSGRVLSIDDRGSMEFRLFFSKAAATP